MRYNNILITIYSLLAILFLYTATSKFLNFGGFVFDMYNQPFPRTLVPFLVWAVPITEIAIVACFFFEKTRLAGLYASLMLMGLFTIYTAAVLFHFFSRVPCSCGGVIKHLTWSQHMIFNLFFDALSAWGIRLNWQTKPAETNTPGYIIQ